MDGGPDTRCLGLVKLPAGRPADRPAAALANLRSGMAERLPATNLVAANEDDVDSAGPAWGRIDIGPTLPTP